MSDGGAARPAPAQSRAGTWTPPHNPVALSGPDPWLPSSTTGPQALTPFVVRLERLESEVAERLQREIGMVGANAVIDRADDEELVALRLALSPGHMEALRTRLMTTTSTLAAIAEEIALAMRCWERVEFEWRCGPRTLACHARPLLMAILNCTPDSFYAGSQTGGDEAVSAAMRMVEEGADLIDVGGESTRPGSDPVAAADEIDRVVPVIEALAGRVDVPISIDTTKVEVARAALDAGATVINDISGLTYEPGLADLAAERGAGLVLMHMRGTPADMYGSADYEDVTLDIVRELRGSVARARSAGVAAEAIVVDPGIGFAKRAEQSLAVLHRLSALRALGAPLLVGPSRKSFLGAVVDLPADERLEGTAAAVAAAVLNGAHVIRVHDPGPMRRVADTAAAIRAEGVGWSS